MSQAEAIGTRKRSARSGFDVQTGRSVSTHPTVAATTVVHATAKPRPIRKGAVNSAAVLIVIG